MSIEEEHLDVLQNIEFGILSVYRQEPSLLDYDVQNAIQALIRHYDAEKSGRPYPNVRLNERAQQVYDSVKPMCELRLGRRSLTDEAESSAEAPQESEERGLWGKLLRGEIVGREVKRKPLRDEEAFEIDPISLDVMIACLKRILTSVRRWTKEGGRQGYLEFVNGFIY